MLKQPIEDLLPRADMSVYKLVRMASRRALELSDGRRVMVDDYRHEKVTTQALEEIRQGKIETVTSAEQNNGTEE